MNIKKIENKINAFFKEVDPNDLIKEFELMGYEFETINDEIQESNFVYSDLQTDFITVQSYICDNNQKATTLLVDSTFVDNNKIENDNYILAA